MVKTSSSSARRQDPDDLPGLIAARGVLARRGGRTSHAAVVARGLGRTCVCGADELRVDEAARVVHVGDIQLGEGDLVSLDGSTGEVFVGAVPVVDSPVVRWLEGEPVEDDLVSAVALLLDHADKRRRLDVRANADTPADAARARRFGASGIGLCRTGTCSSVSGEPWSNGWCLRTASRSAPKRSKRCCPCSAATSRAS